MNRPFNASVRTNTPADAPDYPLPTAARQRALNNWPALRCRVTRLLNGRRLALGEDGGRNVDDVTRSHDALPDVIGAEGDVRRWVVGAVPGRPKPVVRTERFGVNPELGSYGFDGRDVPTFGRRPKSLRG